MIVHTYLIRCVKVKLQMGPRGCEATKKVFMIRLLKYANRTALYAAFVDEFGVRIKARDKSIPGRFFIYKLKPRWVQKYPRKGTQLFHNSKNPSFAVQCSSKFKYYLLKT